MIDCNECLHMGVCVVRQKMTEQTMIAFPDGQAAVFNMEEALLSCDHYDPKEKVAEAPEPSSEDWDYDADLHGQYIPSDDDPPAAPPPVPEAPLPAAPAPEVHTFSGSGLPRITSDQPMHTGVSATPIRKHRISLTGMSKL